jgi:DNA (cytosine-5)-methyltransferase 1
VPIRVLDLFCGGGGSSWGAKAAGCQIVCGVDAWDRAVEAYSQNFGDRRAQHLCMTPRSGPADLGSLGRIDLLLGSPECTHHTCARGSRPRDEQSRETAFYVTNFARRLNPHPRWVVLENVVQMRGWHGYDPLLKAMDRLGYRTAVYTLDASWFGVPQTRRRVFIVGDREAQPPPQDALPMIKGPPRSAREIIDWTGRYASRPLLRPGRARATIERFERGRAELKPGTPFLIVYYGSDGSGGWQTVDRPLRTITTIDRFALVTWQGGIPMMRMLQPDELARAMGFDDEYSLDGIGQRRDRVRLLGNGVCPPVMKAIVQTLTTGASSLTRGSERHRLAPSAAE